MEDAPLPTQPVKVKVKELNNDERAQIVSQLIGMASLNAENRQLPYGAISMVAKNFEVSRQTVSALWNKSILSRLAQKVHKDEVFSHNDNRNKGNRKWDEDEMLAVAKTIPRKQRKTYRALAKRLDVPLTTLYLMKTKRKVFVRHTSSLKPALTDDHKIARIDYALAQRDSDDRS